MAEVADDGLADVYDWLVPKALLTPQGAVGAFSGFIPLPSGGRVLDSACGTGQFAVGLALEGLDVVASDASPAWCIERRNSPLTPGSNSLPSHAPGRTSARNPRRCVRRRLLRRQLTDARSRLRRPACRLGRDGFRPSPLRLLVLASRNWERPIDTDRYLVTARRVPTL